MIDAHSRDFDTTLWGRPEWIGLDYDSARNAMPRLYGVSFGDGNDGVSRMFPRFTCRTCDPYTLAAVAMLDQFTAGEGHAWAASVMMIEGEAEYGVSATIFNPPDDESERDHSQCDDGDDCAGCGQCEGDGMDWCSVNGAWLVVVVFPLDDQPGDPNYTSLSALTGHDTALLVLAESI